MLNSHRAPVILIATLSSNFKETEFCCRFLLIIWKLWTNWFNVTRIILRSLCGQLQTSPARRNRSPEGIFIVVFHIYTLTFACWVHLRKIFFSQVGVHSSIFSTLLHGLMSYKYEPFIPQVFSISYQPHEGIGQDSASNFCHRRWKRFHQWSGIHC